MNRFLINLRSLDNSGRENLESQHFSRFDPVNFRVPDNILGNIGESLDDGTEATLDGLGSDHTAASVDYGMNGVPCQQHKVDEESGDSTPGSSPTSCTSMVEIVSMHKTLFKPF